MLAMGYYGTVKDGKVVLEAGASLADGVRVRVEPVEATNGTGNHQKAVDPADDLARFAVRTGITDLASQHDHYCNGAPRLAGDSAKE